MFINMVAQQKVHIRSDMVSYQIRLYDQIRSAQIPTRIRSEFQNLVSAYLYSVRSYMISDVAHSFSDMIIIITIQMYMYNNYLTSCTGVKRIK